MAGAPAIEQRARCCGARAVSDRVAVVLPVRDGGRHFEPALRSILEQTHRELDIVVSDNHSTDGTPEVARSVGDSRVRIVRPGAPLPISLHHRFAVERTDTELVAIMGADDLAAPERLERQIAYLRAHPNVGLVGCWCGMLDTAGTRVGALRYAAAPEDVRHKAVRANPIVLPTMLFRRAAYDAVGGFRDDFGVAFDYDLVLRLVRIAGVANLPEELLAYRYNTSGGSFRNIRVFQREGLRVRLRALRAGGYPWYEWLWLAKPLAALALPSPALRAIAIPYMRFAHGRAPLPSERARF